MSNILQPWPMCYRPGRARQDRISSRAPTCVGLAQMSPAPIQNARSLFCEERSGVSARILCVTKDWSVAWTESASSPIQLAPDPRTSQEDSLFIHQLYDMCAGDSDIQLFLMCQCDQCTRSEIQQELGWDDNKYEAVQKRKLRLIARWMGEGTS
jgi:hypothetical protein